jgi:hypothetical protein
MPFYSVLLVTGYFYFLTHTGILFFMNLFIHGVLDTILTCRQRDKMEAKKKNYVEEEEEEKSG